MRGGHPTDPPPPYRGVFQPHSPGRLEKKPSKMTKLFTFGGGKKGEGGFQGDLPHGGGGNSQKPAPPWGKIPLPPPPTPRRTAPKPHRTESNQFSLFLPPSLPQTQPKGGNSELFAPPRGKFKAICPPPGVFAPLTPTHFCPKAPQNQKQPVLSAPPPPKPNSRG